MMLSSFSKVRETRQGMPTSSIFNTQHAATCHNTLAKRAQHVAPNNVAICCAEMLQSFGRRLQMLANNVETCSALIGCDRLVGA